MPDICFHKFNHTFDANDENFRLNIQKVGPDTVHITVRVKPLAFAIRCPSFQAGAYLEHQLVNEVTRALKRMVKESMGKIPTDVIPLEPEEASYEVFAVNDPYKW